MFVARRLSASAAVVVLSLASLAHAQNNRIWIGSPSDNKWTNAANWNLGVPGSGDTAFFNNAGGGVTSISLNGAAQPINTITFDNGITPPYTLGVLGSGDKFIFDVGGSIINTLTVGSTQTINADMQLTNGNVSDSGIALALNGNIVAGGTLTVNNQATSEPSTTTTLGGNITEVAGSPASLTLGGTTGAAMDSSFIIKGNNTYTGPTSITVNTGINGSIGIGSDSGFGAGTVTVSLVTVAAQFSAIGADHVVSNALMLNSGMTYIGANSLSFNGPITIQNSVANGVRTLTNLISAAGKSVTFGAMPNSSTIKLGGDDGFGKGLIFAPTSGSTTILNDVIQDAAAGGGAASGNLQFAGSLGGVTKISGLNTYSGGTQFNGNSTVQIASDLHVGDTAGPFGTGLLTLNSSSNNVLEPVGGNREVANPILMSFGLTVANAASDTSGLMLSGPITQGGTGRSITNNMGGTLTLGSPATPSTLTLPTSSGQTVGFTGAGTTVVNDVIQDAAGATSPATSIAFSGTGIVTMAGHSTYTGDNLLNGVSTVRVATDFHTGDTSGPLGLGKIIANSSTNNILEPIGGDRVVANPVSMTFGITTANAPADSSGLTLAGPITQGATGRTFTNNMTGTLTLGLAASPSTITLASGTGQTVSFFGTGNTVVNDVIQDAAIIPSPKPTVAFTGSGIVTLNAHNAYLGDTVLNGGNTIRFSTDYNVGDTSGPFGRGTLIASSSTNSTLEPIGGDRVISNPVSMTFGIKFANAADSSGLTLSGPITMDTGGRTLANNMIGTLTLGSAASPSTWTLPTTGGQTVSIIGSGPTVINDVIKDAAGGATPATAISLGSTGSVAFNALNTYAGDTTATGLAESVRFGASSNALPGASFTAGPLGTGTLILNNTSTAPVLQPVGADRLISNPITLTSGFTASNVNATPVSLTLAGPITLGTTSRIISNNIPIAANLVLGAAAAPSTFTIGSTITIQSQVAGAGSTLINDKLTGAGGLTVQGGAVVQLNNAANDFAGTTLITGTGSKLLVNGSKTGTGAITINTSGTLGGSGTVAGAITNNGTIAPGNSVGTLTATGNVTMAANSHLLMDLGDQLAVGGNLDLSNNEFLDINGSPSGVSWVIATYAGTLTGTFNHVTTGYTVSYGTGTNSQITLTVPLSGVKGDFNNNGRVDAADYVLWRNSVGSNTALPNDNGLGTPIGQSLYDLWRTNFNKPGSGSGTLESGEVPEPTAILLAVFGAVSLLPKRRRSR